MTAESPDLTWKALSENFPPISSEEIRKLDPNYVAMENYFFDYSMLEQSLV